VGLVPAAARLSQKPWPSALRLRAMGFVHALCFRRDSTLQVGCGAQSLQRPPPHAAKAQVCCAHEPP
jgi:hypothetical protein